MSAKKYNCYSLRERIFAGILCAATAVTGASSTSTVMAAGNSVSASSASAVSSAPAETDSTAGSVDPVGSDGTAVEKTVTSDTAAASDVSTSEDTGTTSAAGTVTDGMDFSSARLILGTADEGIIEDMDNVVSSYDGVYLLQYASEKDAENAYAYYADKADFVSPDAGIQAADDASVVEGGEVKEDTDAFTALDAALDDTGDEKEEKDATAAGKTIAVLDSGISKKDFDNVIDAVSMLGENTDDDNGHGTGSMEYILSKNPDARVISVKVLDKNGIGTASAVYAGIRYAEEQKADIILMPLYAYCDAGNAAISEAVREAESAGITVVGAAGNDGNNASYYIPGSITEAMIVGACDEKGNRITKSNYGDTVDYYVKAGSTSEASALMAGFLSSISGNTDDALTAALQEKSWVFANGVEAADGSGADVPDASSGFIAADDLASYVTDGTHPEDQYITQWLGVSKEKILAELNSHTADNYYLTTPYLSLGLTGNLPRPNGDTGGYTAGMQCTGFVVYVLNKAAGYANTVPTMSNQNMYFKISDGKYWGLYGSWLNAFKAHHIIGYYFNSKEDMLKSGKLQKGDILIIDPSGEGLVNNKDADGNVRDGHTGFFWGDSSSEDKFWHSDHHMVNGQTVIMSNVISEITGKLSAPYNNYLVIPLGEPGEGDPGLVRVKKLDAETNQPVAGAVFQFAFKSDDGKHDFTCEFKSDSDGIASIDNNHLASESIPADLMSGNIVKLPHGTMTVTETKAPDGYTTDGCVVSKEGQTLSNTTTVSFRLGEKGWTFQNNAVDVDGVIVKDEEIPPKGGVEIEKFDIEDLGSASTGVSGGCGTGHAQGSATLEGAKIAIVKDDGKTVVTTLTTDANGLAKTASDALDVGKYYAVEITPPKGYLGQGNRTATIDLNSIDISRLDSNLYCSFELTKEKTRSSDPVVHLKGKKTGESIQNEVIRGGVLVVKADSEWKKSESQGDASLDGVTYTIYNESAHPVLVDNKECQPGDAVESIVTEWDASRKAYVATTGTTDRAKMLSYGSYKIVETSVTTTNGYKKDGWEKHFTIDTEGQMVEFKDEGFGWNTDTVYRGKVIIGKVDRETGLYTSLGAAHLDGTWFEIINRSDYIHPSNGTVHFRGKDYKTGEVICREQTRWDDDLKACVLKVDEIPFGTYEIREAEKDPDTKAGSLLSQAGTLYSADNVAGSGLDSILSAVGNLGKNLISKFSIPQERASGTGYLYDNTSRNWYQYFQIRKEGEEVYIDYDFGGDEGNYDGTRTAEQKANNDGDRSDAHPNQQLTYNQTKDTKNQQLSVTYSSGKVTDNQKASVQSAADNQVMRDDIHFNKVDNESKTMPNTIFKITSKTTGESHIIVTGGNGSYDSASYNDSETEGRRKHTYLTNLLDPEIDGNDPSKDRYSGNLARTIQIDKYGDWYVANDDLTKKETDYSTYFYANDYQNNFGTWFTGLSPLSEAGWKAKQKLTQKHIDDLTAQLETAKADEKKAIQNEIADLREKYELEGQWADHAAKDGYAVWNRYFTSSNADGTKTYDGTTYTVYAANGHTNTVKVNDTLRALPFDTYLIEELPCKENKGRNLISFTFTTAETADMDMNDWSSYHDDGIENAGGDGKITGINIDLGTRVNYNVGIYTTLNFVNNANVGTKTAPAGKNVSLVDTVHYDNLLLGNKTDETGDSKPEDSDRYYKLVGELHRVRRTENADGTVTCTADTDVLASGSTTFHPTTTNGDVKVSFDSVDISGLGSDSLVAYEYLYYYYNGQWQLIADHADDSDADQTVSVPAIHTTVKGDIEHVSDGDATEHKGKVTITDTVAYSNLTPGTKYEMTAVLKDKFITVQEKDADGKEISVPATLLYKDFLGNYKPVTNTVSFTPDKADGSVDVPVKISLNNLYLGTSDGEDEDQITKLDSLAGRTVVAFETLSVNGETYAVHEDINDNGQTVTFPEIHTTATVNDTGDHTVTANDQKNTVVYDEVQYTNLIPGKTYTIYGVLHRKTYDLLGNAKDGGVLTDEDGNDVTGVLVDSRTKKDLGTTEFTPEKASGSVLLKFTFATKLLTNENTGEADSELVAFETLKREKTTVAAHADISDAYQTVAVSSMKTMAVDAETGTHQMTSPVDENGKPVRITINDTVSYIGLVPGKTYDIKGKLVDKKTGQTAQDAEGNDITFSVTFQAKKADGSQVVPFTFTGMNLTEEDRYAGFTLVAFETLYDHETEKPVYKHENVSDADQTIYIAGVKTTATDSDTDSHTMSMNREIHITDRVEYKNLIPGKKYTVTGTLHYQEKRSGGRITDGGAVTDNSGETVTATKEFTPTAADGYVDLKFTFVPDADEIAGKKVVAFESLTQERKLVGVHADITDEAQSVMKPSIHTTVKGNVENDTHKLVLKEDTTFTDTVTYEDLIPGEEYTLIGTLMDKGTNAPVTVNNENVTSEKTFTAKGSAGTVDVKFEGFDLREISSQYLVVFEKLYKNGEPVAEHEDFNDADQSLTPEKETPPETKVEIHTTADLKDVDDDGTATVVDTVKYYNLTPGKTYVLKGILMDKSEDREVLVDGSRVTANKEFTPTEADGTADVTFTFNAEKLNGRKLVVFEELYLDDELVADHKDINDEDQTVEIPEKPEDTVTPTPTPKQTKTASETKTATPVSTGTSASQNAPQTGVRTIIPELLILLAAIGAGIVGTVIYRKRRTNRNSQN